MMRRVRTCTPLPHGTEQLPHALNAEAVQSMGGGVGAGVGFAAQTLSEEALGATVSICETLHTVSAVHARSRAVLGAADSNCDALHVVSAAHAPPLR
jgi:hypothetical protein